MNSPETRWAEHKAKLAGLWPEWAPTPDQAAEWKKALAPKNTKAVTQAIEQHYRESEWREPNLQAVLRNFRAMFQTQVQGSDRPTLAKLAEWEKLSAADQEAKVRMLLKFDAGTLKWAFEFCRARYHIIAGSVAYRPNPVDWPRIMVGFVWTLIYNPPETVKPEDLVRVSGEAVTA